MPISLAVDEARRILVALATGDLTIDEMRTFIATARAGEYADWPLLFDASDARSSASAAEVSSLAAQVGAALRQTGPRAPVAIVATDDALFGIMRMYQILCENRGVEAIHVCRTVTEANAALGQ